MTHQKIRQNFCKLIALVALSLTCASQLAFAQPSPTALSLAVVSKQKVTDLRNEFRQANAKKNKIAQTVIKKTWSCDMYGVRSRFQVERSVPLYRFHKKDHKFINHGAQVIAQYNLTKNELLGSEGNLVDAVRLTEKGQLIDRLSVKRKGTWGVIAYSVCHTE